MGPLRTSSFACVVLAAGGVVLSVQAAPNPKACPPEMVWNERRGGCVCAAGWSWNDVTRRCMTACPPGQVLDPKVRERTCKPLKAEPTACPKGKRWSDPHAGCVLRCGPGRTINAQGTACVDDRVESPLPSDAGADASKSCPPGREWKDAFDACVPICGPREVLDFHGIACHDATLRRR